MAWTIAWTGVQLAIIVILAVGAWRVDEGLLEVSSLIAFLLYAFGLMGPITELTQQITALQSGIAAASRIRDVDALELERDVPAVPSTAAAGGPILALRDVTAAYGSDDVIRGVELEVPRRGHTAIVGPSGAGKTTLFSLILRFLEPRDGALELDGRPYASWSHAEVRDRLAYVEQETPVVPGTIRENVVLGRPDATEAECRGRDARGPARRPRPGHAAVRDDASPAASASGSRSPARSCAPPTCCCSTRPPPRSTASPRARSTTASATGRRSAPS